MRPAWGFVFLGAVAVGSVFAAKSKERPLPVSAYRKYVWEARRAFERREYNRAHQLLQTYKGFGSPADPLVKSAGCDPKEEVRQFGALLKTARACQKNRKTISFWTNVNQAKVDIQAALRSGRADAIAGYVDCAPKDLTAPPGVCPTAAVATPEGLLQLASYVHAHDDIVDRANWREFPLEGKAKEGVRWVLHTYSDEWKPCGADAAPIVSLWQDKDGKIRIAGHATSCLTNQ